MQITAGLVKELRERTGAGMMECKKALTEVGGDIEAAIELMRKSGQAKADKKAGRIAAEGRVEVAARDGQAVILEVNSETDFVAKDVNFAAFAKLCAETALTSGASDVAELMQKDVDGESLEAKRLALVTKIGENIQVRRFARVEGSGTIGVYLHGARIAVVTQMDGGDEELARDVAMHIAASRPLCVQENEVPAETIAKEREIFAAQAAESGKPVNIIEKMVDGRVRKFLAEVTLLGQPFVKNPDQTVGALLQERGVSAKHFVRFEVGEGLEKKSENFAEEVMAQARGA
jgi:elongation factor Ts